MSKALIEKTLEPFAKYFKTKGLIEVIINKPCEVVLETREGWIVKKDPNLTLKNLTHMATLLASISGQKFDDENPLLATHIPEYGFRIQVLGGALVDSGFALSIRVGTSQVFPLDSYMEKTESDKLIQAIIDGKNMLIVGGTGSGKTTLINSMVTHINDNYRIVTIEDTKELIIPQENTTRIIKSKSGTDLASISYSDIINACVRIRPDRILVGEISIDNTMPFLRLLNTGHGGTMATIHANTADKGIDALVINAKLADAGGNDSDIRDYALSALDVLLFIHRDKDRKFKVECKYL